MSSSIKQKNNLIGNPFTVKKFLKTKVKPYGNEATDFHSKEMPKADSNYTCSAVILIGFVFKKVENYTLKKKEKSDQTYY